jgi:hypothetical protein
MVSRMLDAINGFRFIWLIRVLEFFDAFAGGVSDLRKALGIS